MSEKSIVDACVRELDRRGAWHCNLHPATGRAGLPDRLTIHHGTPIALEMKGPGGRLGPLQAHELDRFRRAGGVALVVRDVQQLRDFLDEVERATS